MPTNTGAPWNLPSPTLPEQPDGPGDLSALADSVHAALGRAYPCLSSAHPSPTEGLLIFETDTDTMLISRDGSTWSTVWRAPEAQAETTDAATASTNFSLSSQRWYRLGGLAIFTMSITRLNSTLASTSTGNITNTQMAAVGVGWRPRVGYWHISGGAAVGQHATGYVDENGVMAISTLPPGTPACDWLANNPITWSGSFPLATG